MKLKAFYLILFFFIVGIDFTSKYYTFLLLNHTTVPVVSNFFGVSILLCSVANYGAAFGILSKYPFILAIFRFFVSLLLLAYILVRKQKLLHVLGLVLISAGSLSNSLDYFYYGYVVDMISFQYKNWSFPVFNLADASICLGAFLVILFPGALKR